MSIGDLKWKQQDNRLIGAVLDDQKLEHIDNFMSVRFLIIHWQPLIGTNLSFTTAIFNKSNES